jgi:hypothetical protein
MSDEGAWINTDEAEGVAASVRRALRCWEHTLADPQAWKWVTLARHAALQGACMCHLLTKDHRHGGGHITIREMIVIVFSREEPLAAMQRAMGDYPICHADLV